MPKEVHLETLKDKHQALKVQIDAERQKPHPDDLTIQQMKREKLKLKDEITRLSM